MTLLCLKCGEEKSLDSFHKATRNTHRHGLQTYCKLCMAAYGKVWGATHKTNQRESYARNKSKPENKLKSLLSATTVDRSELDFEWAWEKLKAQEFKCELTGANFTWGTREPTTLSIDRLDPTKGYTKDNVRFVCWWINAAMGTWGFEKLVELIKDSNLGTYSL